MQPRPVGDIDGAYEDAQSSKKIQGAPWYLVPTQGQPFYGFGATAGELHDQDRAYEDVQSPDQTDILSQLKDNPFMGLAWSQEKPKSVITLKCDIGPR